MLVEPGSTGAGGGSSTTTFTATNDTGTGGSSATSTSSSVTRRGDRLGEACTFNEDCGPRMRCLSPQQGDEVFGGGAPGGLCTLPCTSDADCPGSSGACYGATAARAGRCVLRCDPGPPATGLFEPLRADKCLGREELRCTAVPGASAVCLPLCGRDEQCGRGHGCDPSLGVCVASPREGAPLGTACDPMAKGAPCAGQCVGFNDGTGVCSSPCALGGLGVGSSDCGGPAHGLCAFRPASAGAGDVGFCTPSCHGHDSCGGPHFFCFTVPELTPTYGAGYCFAAKPCPAGQADCVDHAGKPLPAVCTEVGGGHYCLDPGYPAPDRGEPVPAEP